MKRFRERFDEIIDHLSEYPESGRERPEYGPAHQSFPIKNLRVTVFYAFVYLENGGQIEHAQSIAGHESPRTTKLYDRRSEVLELDEIEKISM